MQGLMLGHLGLIYDQGYVFDEKTADMRTVKLVPYKDVVAGVAGVSRPGSGPRQQEHVHDSPGLDGTQDLHESGPSPARSFVRDPVHGRGGAHPCGTRGGELKRGAEPHPTGCDAGLRGAAQRSRRVLALRPQVLGLRATPHRGAGGPVGSLAAVGAAGPGGREIPLLRRHRRPARACGNLLQTLAWERQIELALVSVGIEYFEQRGFGPLRKGDSLHMPSRRRTSRRSGCRRTRRAASAGRVRLQVPRVSDLPDLDAMGRPGPSLHEAGARVSGARLS
jgi:hypothetical protein